VDGLSPKAKRFLAVLIVLIFLFMVEPIPLEITAILIGVFLVLMQIVDVKTAWAPYMHPVVVFIMCCLIFAIALDKAGITKRLGHYIVAKAGTSVTKFTFIISIGLGLASSFMHDAAAVSIGIVTMLPLMRAAGIEPHSRTAKFMLISLAFACSCGGMGTLVGGGRTMVSAAFLKEFTGIEITFMDWIKYAMPMAIVTVPAAVTVVYLVFRPDPKYQLPKLDGEIGPWSSEEKLTLIIIALSFLLWLTKEFHGLHYSITGMLGVAALVVAGILRWDDVHENLEWGTALFIFGGGISLGLAMGNSGAAAYFANLFFPACQGRGVAASICGCGGFRCLGDQRDGQCGGGGAHFTHRYSHGVAGRCRSKGAGPLPGNLHVVCHAAGHRLSAQRHCLQFQGVQGFGHHQGRAGGNTGAADHSHPRRLGMVEGIGTRTLKIHGGRLEYTFNGT
jgi:sodium-dependent dicarboxylate transporter 2/3/5